MEGGRKIILAGSLLILLLLYGLAFTHAAHAVAQITISDSPGGGQCSSIGSWDPAGKVCTMTTDLTVFGGNDGIEIISNGVTLDGAGHTLAFSGSATTQSGVVLNILNGITVRHLTVKGFAYGFLLQISSNNVLRGNLIENNKEGMYIWGGNSNGIYSNTLSGNSSRGLYLEGSDSNYIIANNFLGNAQQAEVVTSSGNSFSVGTGNYWDDFDSRPEGCINSGTSFNITCDVPYNFTGGSDPDPLVLKDAQHRRDWTWYDDAYGDNWVLLANSPTAMDNKLFRLAIGNVAQPLASIPGYEPGYVPPGMVIYNKYAGLIGGPVTSVNYGLYAIASQRILWPKGGGSLEEVPGAELAGLHCCYYWPWYDMKSPGFKNWILIANPNAYQVYYSIRIGNTLVDDGAIPANGQVTPQFPGVIGGPVEVEAWNDFGDPVYIMASQRVLSNGDKAFNEVPGQPANKIASSYVWTWYDMKSPGASNWVMVTNPHGTATPVYYEVWIEGVFRGNGGPIAAGTSSTYTFPGTIGGPVEVRCFADPARTTPTNCVSSQRSIWGPSFEEVPGADKANLTFSYGWTWYDQKSPGSLNWVMVANPSPTATITATIEYRDADTGMVSSAAQFIGPGAYWTRTFPGGRGGPVTVDAVQQGTSIPMPVIASQRVVWNGYFNEVWGQ